MQQSKSVAFLLGASCLFSWLFLTGCGSTTTSSTPAPAPTAALGNNFLFESFHFKSRQTRLDGEVTDKFFDLKSQCLRDNVPVITSMSYGHTSWPYMVYTGQGYTDGYVVTFQSEDDRFFYENCAARENLVEFVSPLIVDIMPYNPGYVYNPGQLEFDYNPHNGTDMDKMVWDVVHMFFFRFKEGIASDTQNDVMARFLSLKEKCHIYGRPVVETLVGGHATSAGSSADQLYSQGYYMEFADSDDLSFFLGCYEGPCHLSKNPPESYCQAHDDFKVYAGEFFESAQNIPPGSSSNPALHYNPGRFSFNFISEETAEIVT